MRLKEFVRHAQELLSRHGDIKVVMYSEDDLRYMPATLDVDDDFGKDQVICVVIDEERR